MLNYQRVSVLSKLGDAPTIGPRYRLPSGAITARSQSFSEALHCS